MKSYGKIFARGYPAPVYCKKFAQMCGDEYANLCILCTGWVSVQPSFFIPVGRRRILTRITISVIFKQGVIFFRGRG